MKAINILFFISMICFYSALMIQLFFTNIDYIIALSLLGFQLLVTGLFFQELEK